MVWALIETGDGVDSLWGLREKMCSKGGVGIMKPIVVKTMSQKRFNAFVRLSRNPIASYFGQEIAWYSNDDETVIGVVLRDRIDHDYACVMLARDNGGRYRAFDFKSSLETEASAKEWLDRVIKSHTRLGLQRYQQGDEAKTLDLFTPVLPIERLNPDFVRLSNDPSLMPARSIITEMMPHYTDVDGNFVDQFQSTGFDARVWELYLFAYIAEEELFLDRDNPAPDFLVSKYGETVAIEAVTVGRKSDNPPKYIKSLPKRRTPEELREERESILPIKFGSPLYSKLQKRYWTLPHVQGRPLVFAIADFHEDLSMVWSTTPLINYLYGVRHEFHYDEHGQLVITPIQLESHRVGTKEIPSGFFFQPGAENVSAVLFSASGTISKFNRIGRQSGFRDPHTIMVRVGTCHDHDPNASVPKRFRYVVDERCNETWAEGLSMFHNPNAINPVSEELFPSVAHHHFQDGQIISKLPDFYPYASLTYNLRFGVQEE